MTDYILTPNGQLVMEGTAIVAHPEASEDRWIVHNGWYTYLNEISKGWYIVRISDGRVEPLIESTLSNIIVISSDGVLPQPDPSSQEINEG